MRSAFDELSYQKHKYDYFLSMHIDVSCVFVLDPPPFALQACETSPPSQRLASQRYARHSLPLPLHVCRRECLSSCGRHSWRW